MPYRMTIVRLILLGLFAAPAAILAADAPESGIDIDDWPVFLSQLIDGKNADRPSPGKRIWSLLPIDVQDLVEKSAQADSIEIEDKHIIINELNIIIDRRDFYREEDFNDYIIPAKAGKLLDQKRKLLDQKGEELTASQVKKLNRLLIEKISPRPKKKRAWLFIIAKWLGRGLSAVALALFVSVFLLHLRLSKQEKRRARFIEVWSPIMENCLVEVPDPLPSIEKNELTFITVWNYYQEQYGEPARPVLNKIVRDVGIQPKLDHMLAKGTIQEQLLAMATLGYLSEKGHWNRLLDISRGPNIFLSLAAIGALIQIDPEYAIAHFVPLLVEREDWPPFRVARILEDAGADRVSQSLVDAVKKAPAEELPRLVRYMSVGDPMVVLPSVEGLLAETESENVVLACLHVLIQFKVPQAVDHVRACVEHPRWQIRTKAATALGEFGIPEDEGRLTGLLGDEEWWVRYRAAQALAKIVHMDIGRLEGIRNSQEDRYAADMINHVIAENRL